MKRPDSLLCGNLLTSSELFFDTRHDDVRANGRKENFYTGVINVVMRNGRSRLPINDNTPP